MYLIDAEESVFLQTAYEAVLNGEADASCGELRLAVQDAFLSWYALLADGVVTEDGLSIPDRYVTEDVELITTVASQLFVDRQPCTGASNEQILAAAQAVIAIKPARGPRLGTNVALIGLLVVTPIVLGVYLGKVK